MVGEGLNRPWIINLSRAGVEFFIPGSGAVCVSITDPGGPPARMCSYDARCNQQFHDLTRMPPSDGIVLGASAPYILFSDEQAKELGEFLLQHRGKNIVVHCEAGVSRSGGVVEAVLAAFPEYEDKKTPRFANVLVKTKLLPILNPNATYAV